MRDFIVDNLISFVLEMNLEDVFLDTYEELITGKQTKEDEVRSIMDIFVDNKPMFETYADGSGMELDYHGVLSNIVEMFEDVHEGADFSSEEVYQACKLFTAVICEQALDKMGEKQLKLSYDIFLFVAKMNEMFQSKRYVNEFKRNVYSNWYTDSLFCQIAMNYLLINRGHAEVVRDQLENLYSEIKVDYDTTEELDRECDALVQRIKEMQIPVAY